MRVEENFIYLDEYCRGNDIGYSFALDIANKSVIYSKECLDFLENIKDSLEFNTYRLVGLNIFNCKGNFESIICRNIFGLEVVGCIQDVVFYKIPITLSEEIFSRVYNFNYMDRVIKDILYNSKYCSVG